MKTTEQTELKNLTYQQIFEAFNASPRNTKPTKATEDFEKFSNAPETIFNVMDTARSLATQQQLHNHKTSFLKAFIATLNKNTWGPQHMEKLTQTTDWLISLKETRPHSTNYLQQLRILFGIIKQTVPIPDDQQQKWVQATKAKREPWMPKEPYGQPEIVYGQTFRVSHCSYVGRDDRE